MRGPRHVPTGRPTTSRSGVRFEAAAAPRTARAPATPKLGGAPRGGGAASVGATIATTASRVVVSRATAVRTSASSAARPAPGALRERRPGGPPRPTAGRQVAPARTPRPRSALPALARVRVLRPAGVLDRLLRGRVWVALIGLLLTGIVFLNVSLLELNSGIARTDARASDLRRDNASLRMRVARLGSSERIQRAAAARGFVAARPGQVGYLRPHRDDPARAARALEDWRPPQPPPATPSARAGLVSGSAGAGAGAGAGVASGTRAGSAPGAASDAGAATPPSPGASAGAGAASGAAAQGGAGPPRVP